MHAETISLFSPTSVLMQMWDSHDSDYAEHYFLGYDIVYSGKCLLMLERNVLPPSSESKSK
jgi:hypothetical protein